MTDYVIRDFLKETKIGKFLLTFKIKRINFKHTICFTGENIIIFNTENGIEKNTYFIMYKYFSSIYLFSLGNWYVLTENETKCIHTANFGKTYIYI